MKRFKWTIEVEVDEVWVADGFDLTAERAHDIMWRALSYARGDEIRCKVIKAPLPADVLEAQGYPRRSP